MVSRWLMSWLCAWGIAAAADVRFESLPEMLVPGANVDVVLVIDDLAAAVRNVRLPALDGLTLRQMRRSERQITIINGHQSTTERLHVQLGAERLGRFTLPPIAIELDDGSSLVTKPAMITVGHGDPTLVGEFVAGVSFEPLQAVVGQRVTMTYRMARRDHSLQLRTLGIGPPPDTTTLSESEITVSTAFAADGAAWSVLSKRWELRVTAPGTLTVSGQQEYLPCRANVFGQWEATARARRVSVPPAQLVVAAVPSQGRPPEWQGLLGPMSLEMSLDRERIAVGEGARLHLRLVGRDAALVPLPPPLVSGAMPVRPRPTTPDPLAVTAAYDLVPSEPGTYTITAPPLATFDPEAGGFQRLSAPALTLTVLPGNDRSLVIAGANAADAPAMPLATWPEPASGRWPSPRPTVAWMAVALGLLLGLGSGLGLRWRARPRRAHRGRRLESAIQAGDLASAAAILQSLHSDLPAAARLAAALESARFGGTPLADLGAELAQLRELP